MRSPRPHPIVVIALLVCATAAASEAAAQENRFCLVCHGDTANFAGRADSARLVVTQREFAGSVHGSFGMSCVTCHAGLRYPHPEDVPPVECGMCHATEARQYSGSVHGYALERGNERAPTCAGCHGEHDIRHSSDPAARTYHTRIAATCTTCHSSGGLLTDEYIRLPMPALQYARSVHGEATGSGSMEAATCTDCHGVHDLRGRNDPLSRINRLNVTETCGSCHGVIAERYDESIHGRALQAGVGDSPTCTDCHGEHLILHPNDPDAGTHASQIAVDLCGECHNDPVIIAKYRLRPDVVVSYTDSYHGWATRRSRSQAATCISCHSAHLVLPSADPRSTVSDQNVVATCGACHEDATPAFARSYDHAAASVATNRGRRIVTTLYIGLIVIVIGGMALHNAIIFNYFLTEKRRRERRERSFLRFDRIQVAQHATLALSFIVLVITGFALRYPEAGWARWSGMAALSEPLRSGIHRGAGVALITFSIVHVLYVVWSRRGREEFRAMAPSTQDFRDLAANLKYHTWLTRTRPRFSRYDYTQKAEYWALVWGTALMAITGLVLWLPSVATALAPAWIVSISETVHFYEAWLATLAIIVWHLFFVIFHPEVYPMSWIWLTGQMPEHEARMVHGRWYAEELAGRESAAHGESPDGEASEA